MDAKITEILVCPLCKGPLLWSEKKKEFYCRSDMKAFPVIDGIPCMVPTEAREMKEEEIESFAKTVEETQQRLLNQSYVKLTWQQMAEIYKELY